MRRILYSVVFALLVVIAVTQVSGGPATCGGRANGTSGSFDFTGPENKQCNLTFGPITTTLTQICFLFSKVSLYSGDYIEIYNGTASNETLVTTITSDNATIGPVISLANNTELVFFPKDGKGTFTVDFETDTTKCVQKITTSSQANIEGPTYPKGSGVECVIEIDLADVTQKAALTFTEFTLSKGEVLVYDNSEKKKLYAYFTDGTPAHDIILNGTAYIKISYGADENVVQNLAGNFYVVSESSVQMNLTKETLVTTPGYPNNYENNMEMIAILKTGEPGKTLRLKFEDIDLADAFDTIRLVDGGTRYSRPIVVVDKGLESIGPEIMWLTSSDTVFIHFTSDESQTAKGFNLSVTSQSIGGALVNSGQVLLQTDNKTVQHPDDLVYFQCIVEEGQQVALKIDNYTAQDQKYASSISFYDGLTEDDPLIGYFTTVHEYYPVVSNHHELLIKAEGYFKDTKSVGPQLFQATFAAQESDVLYKTSAVESDVYVLEGSKTSEAVWVIHRTEERHHISLHINQYLLEEKATIAIYEHLNITDVHPLINLTALNSANGQSLPPVHLEQARIVYSTNNKTAGVGINNVLQASYDIHPICESEISGQAGGFGFLKTPYYPDRHPLNLHCYWNFPGVVNTTVRLFFEDFQVFSPSYVEIIDINATNPSDNVTIVKAFGESLPDDHIWKGVKGRNTFVRLVSDLNDTSGQDIYNSGRGLFMKYENLTDGGNITSTKQDTVQNPSKSDPEKNDVDAVWVVYVPERDDSKDKSSVNIIQYSVSAKVDKYARLEIKDGGAHSSPLVNLTFKNDKTETLLSRTNKLWIKYEFMKNGTKDAHTGFPFTVTYSPKKCTTLCNNGICLHDDWKCNGIDDCGDGTDETNCNYGPGGNGKGGVSYALLGGCIVATLIITLLIAVGGPVLYRKYKTRGGYSDLNEPVNPTA